MKHFRAVTLAVTLATISIFLTGCDTTSGCGSTPESGTTSIFSIGDTVPDFTLPDQYGTELRLDDVLAEDGVNGAILAFYIKDNTPG